MRMVKMLMIADDFTGALDTGVQFAVRGAETRVVTDPAYDFSRVDAEVQVLVLDAETRHLPPQEAYSVVARAVRGALDAGFTTIYKKTDSALRGNIGAELTAMLDAAGAESLPFIPAFPRMDRVTRGGIHYIGGVPVAESVFGRDPFEPVRLSGVKEMIAQQSDVPVVLHGQAEAPEGRGIHVYDAESDGDLECIGRTLGRDGVRLSAGCAGFAAVLAELLGLEGNALGFPELEPVFFVACGSVNPVTIQQMQTAEEAGFAHIHLRPVQKLDPAWPESQEGREAIQSWLIMAEESGCCILDVNDPRNCNDTAYYADAHGLTLEDMRVRISTQLGKLMRALLDGGLEATILCTGGDTLLALMRTVGVAELTPVCEMAPGAVLTSFTYRDKDYHIISKSGGFGEPDLFCGLAALIGAGKK